jgi:hypothetical protein
MVKRLVAAAVLVAGAAAAAVVIALEAGGSGAPAPQSPISVQAAMSPGAVHFGDTVTAHAVVVLDPARVDVASVRLVPRFLAYDVAHVARDVQPDGKATTVSYDLVLECLGAGCAPGRPQVVLQFPPALLHYRTPAGDPGRYAFAWPSITVSSRLDDADRADPYAGLRTDTTPPPVSYSVSPGTLADGLVGGAGFLVLAAGALFWLAFRRRAAPRPVEAAAAGDPLEEALRLVREIAGDGHRPELRRLALQRLVTELRATGRADLAESVGQVAWSDGPPSPGGARELADRVEQQVEEP